MLYSIKVTLQCIKCKKQKIFSFNGTCRYIPESCFDITVVAKLDQVKPWHQWNDNWFCSEKCSSGLLEEKT